MTCTYICVCTNYNLPENKPKASRNMCPFSTHTHTHAQRIKVHLGIFWVRWVHLDWHQLSVGKISLYVSPTTSKICTPRLARLGVCVGECVCEWRWLSEYLGQPLRLFTCQEGVWLHFSLSGRHVFPCVPPFPFVSCHFSPHFSSSSSSSNNSPSPLYLCVFPPSSFSFPVSSPVQLLLRAPMNLPWIVHPVFYPFNCCSHLRQVRMKLVHTVSVMWVFWDKLCLHYFLFPPQDKWCYDSPNPGLDAAFIR